MKKLLVVTLLCAANLQAAPNYTSNWSAFDGGFGRSLSGRIAHCGVFDSWLRQPMQSANYTVKSVGLPMPAASPIVPSLSIALAGNNVRVSWPASASGFILEAKSPLGNGAWTDIPAPYQSTGTEQFILLPLSEAGRFFRLRSP